MALETSLDDADGSVSIFETIVGREASSLADNAKERDRPKGAQSLILQVCVKHAFEHLYRRYAEGSGVNYCNFLNESLFSKSGIKTCLFIRASIQRSSANNAKGASWFVSQVCRGSRRRNIRDEHCILLISYDRQSIRSCSRSLFRTICWRPALRLHF
jgi:hypothetical protein